ncbi:GNAT family N-acetyltransferase [Bacteroidota bacterium]
MKEPLFLHSLEKTVNFYLKHGFEIAGEEFMETGISHVQMDYIV